MIEIEEFKKCFNDFNDWTVKTNTKRLSEVDSLTVIQRVIFRNFRYEGSEIKESKEDFFKIPEVIQFQYDILIEILDLLLKYPDANYFWIDGDDKLQYYIPCAKIKYQIVPSVLSTNSKMKEFIRSYKIDQIIE